MATIKRSTLPKRKLVPKKARGVSPTAAGYRGNNRSLKNGGKTKK